MARVAANALSERYQLLDEVCPFPTPDPANPLPTPCLLPNPAPRAATPLSQLLSCMGGDGELPALAATILLEVVRKHGAAPSAVLQRCDIEP